MTKSRVAARCQAHSPHLKIENNRVGVEKVKEQAKGKLTKLNELVEALCGIYSRVARRLGVHRTFVSRVARGERRSPPVENALVAEYERAKRE